MVQRGGDHVDDGRRVHRPSARPGNCFTEAAALSEMRITLPYGRTYLSAEIPGRADVEVLRPSPLRPRSDPGSVIGAAIDSSGLEEEPSGRVVVVVDDHTRPCPTEAMLGPLLSRLRVPADRITVLFATGTHRAVRPEEAREILGRFYGRLRAVSHDCRGALAEFGSTSRGTPVAVDEEYCSADYRILLGDVEPHYFAGYGGGRKSILPGVSGYETVQANHKLMFEPGAEVGVLDGNPVHEDMEEAADMVGADFTLNVVQNPEGEVVSAHAGHYREVLRAGARVVDSMYKVPVEGEADVVVVAASGHPHDVDMYQAYKALHMALRVVRPGGTIVFAAECRDGAGSSKYLEYMRRYGSSEEVEEALRRRFELGGHKAYYHLRAVERCRVIAVTSIPADEVRGLYRMEPAPSLQEAVDRALEGLDSPRVVVMPEGSTTIPVGR